MSARSFRRPTGGTRNARTYAYHRPDPRLRHVWKSQVVEFDGKGTALFIILLLGCPRLQVQVDPLRTLICCQELLHVGEVWLSIRLCAGCSEVYCFAILVLVTSSAVQLIIGLFLCAIGYIECGDLRVFLIVTRQLPTLRAHSYLFLTPPAGPNVEVRGAREDCRIVSKPVIAV